MPDPEQTKNKHIIPYTVDGEPQKTTEKELTATQIVKLAGLDPEQRYLLLVVPGKDPSSYQGRMDANIEMKPGMHFITAGTGPTPTS